MRRALVSSITLAFGVAVGATDRPSETLPDRDAFVAEIRARLRTDEELQNQYTYVEKRQRIRISKLGQVELGNTRLFEVYPGSEPGQRYRRLIAVNDVPLEAGVLQQRDAARRKFLTDRAEILTNETLPERAARERRQAEARRRQQDIVDDVFRVFEMRLVGKASGESACGRCTASGKFAFVNNGNRRRVANGGRPRRPTVRRRTTPSSLPCCRSNVTVTAPRLVYRA